MSGLVQLLNGLDAAIARFDLVAYLRDHAADQVSADEWLLICPQCMKEKLTVHVRKKTWHCWVCERYAPVIGPGGARRRAIAGAGGLLDLIQILEKVDRRAAAQKVLAAGHTTAAELEAVPEVVPNLLLPSRYCPEIPWPDFSTDDFWAGLPVVFRNQKFLRDRGISERDVGDYRLAWCFDGQYAHRIIFPVFEHGRLVYWQARAMWDPIPGQRYVKALNPPRQEGVAVSSEVLFNLDRAAAYRRVALTEGPIDAIHVGVDAVATFGKALHPAQVGKLLAAGVEAIDFFWDADAHAEAFAAARQVAALFDVRVVVLPNGDPGDYSREQNAQFRAAAQPLLGLQVLD